MSRSRVLSLAWVYLTPYLDRRSATSGGTRLAIATVLPFSGAFSLPVMRSPETTTSAILSAASSFSNSLYGTTSTVCARCHHCCRERMANMANSR
jgi:hypothetical protein